MKLELKDPSTLAEVVFQYDSGELPPPFCYRYRMNVILQESQPEISFNIEYYDRDDLTEEEIYDEGFSPEDDFRWKGKLPALWKDLLLEKLLQSGWKRSIRKKNIMQTAELNVRLRYLDGTSERLWPEQLRTWEDFLQEVIQAVYEVSKRERPLVIRYMEKDNNEKIIEKELIYRFAERKIKVEVKINNRTSRSYDLDWKSGKKIMKDIFFPDYDSEMAIERNPKNQGKFIDPGMGIWFNLENAVHTPNPKKDASKIIFNHLNQL